MHGLIGVFGPAADRAAALVAAQPRRSDRRVSDEPEISRGDGFLLGVQHIAVVNLFSGTQPITYPPAGPDRGGYVVAFNGEIYNRRQLREILSTGYGAAFETGHDAEV